MESGQLSPAPRERRQVAAAIDVLVVFGICFAVSAAGNLANWQFWIAFGAIWFLVEVPTVAIRGKTIGHLLTSTRVTAACSDMTPGRRRALTRWLALVPAAVRNRFGDELHHDRWSDTAVVLDPYGPAAASTRDDGDAAAPRSDSRWRARARALERFAREHPRQYRARVALIAAGGYAFLLSIAAAQLGAATVLLTYALHGSGSGIRYASASILALLGLTTLSTLWLGRSLPPGLPLEPADAPDLFALVDELRHRLGAPRVDAIVLDPTATAGLLTQPRFGPFGPYRNVLVLGMTLLRALPVDEMRAVLAHEIGHLQRQHGPGSAWIYRLRYAYPRLLDHLEHKGWTAMVAQLFLERYTPYFELWSRALARTQEFEADRLAASVAGPATFGAALQRINLLHELLDEKGDLPAQAPVEHVDDHPSVARRLAALGVRPSALAPVELTAASAWIPEELDSELIDLFGLFELFHELEDEDAAPEPAAQAMMPARYFESR